MTTHLEVPAILLPYQQRWIADASSLKIADKSRQIGITWATALEAVLVASTSKAHGGMNVWYMTNKLNDGKLFIRDVAMWVRALNIAAEEIETPLVDDESDWNLVLEVKFQSGHSVTALSSNPDGLRGKGGLVILDEAACVDDLDAFLAAARAFTIWGGRIALISTQREVGTGFHKLIESIQAGQNQGTIHRVTFDDAIEQGFYRRICHTLGIEWTQERQDSWRQRQIDEYGDLAGQELFCIPSSSGGRMFSRMILEQCADASIPILRLKLEDDFALLPEDTSKMRIQRWLEQEIEPIMIRLGDKLDMFFGEDFGRISDLSVLCPMYIDQHMNRRIPFMIEMRNVPTERQLQVVFFVLDWYSSRGKLVGGIFDKGGNGSYIAEAAVTRYSSSKILQVQIGGGAPRNEEARQGTPSLKYSEAIPPLKARFEDRGIVIPKDRDVIQDLEMFERKDGLPCLPSTRLRGSDREYRHGDSGVAIMLAHYATLEMAHTPFKVTVPRRFRGVRL